METQAVAKWMHRGPRKVRRFIDLIRGRTVDEARAVLGVQASPAARDVLRCLNSAVANGENNHGMAQDDMIVTRAVADDGPRMRRMRPRARGRADIYIRPTCHITIVVSDETDSEA
jgi:large subunit ribosomal protein L22